ncbi:MAG: nucleotidyltransferase [Polaromonas sp.]|nr:nucleotidyltransferase [Polaromonas sp.]
MHRDPLPMPLKRQLSRVSSPKFFYLADAIAKYNEPTQTQLDAMERSYGATGSYVMESEEFRDLTIAVHAQGSRVIGTLTRPTKWRPDGFDIDVVIRLRHAANLVYGDNPAKLLNDLYTVLKRYAEMHGLGITRWERCITLEYADGMRADITPIIEDPLFSILHGETHAKVPDRKLHLFEPSNPMGLANAFNDAARISPLFTTTKLASFSEAAARGDMLPLPDADEVLNRLLARLVQLLKLHRNVAFGVPTDGPDFAPRSIFLTSLAAAAYALRAPIAHESPLDLLLDIVDTMPLCFERHQLASGGEFWNLPNLTAPGDNLASGMNTSERQAAFANWHSLLTNHLQQILQCIEQREGLDTLLKVIDEAFGSRAAQAVRELEEPRPIAKPDRRIITVGTAAATTMALPARGHTFFGN